MTNDILIQFVFGAPAGILSLLVSVLGIWKKWPVALVLAGLWAAPANYYLSAAFDLPLYWIGLFQFGAAYAVYKDNKRIAWFLLIPLLLLTLVMVFLSLYAVLLQ